VNIKIKVALVIPEDVQKMIEDNPNTLIVDVRDAWNIRQTGIISGVEQMLGKMQDFLLRNLTSSKKSQAPKQMYGAFTALLLKTQYSFF
jgi:rhodanese-related sulfurtransferase